MSKLFKSKYLLTLGLLSVGALTANADKAHAFDMDCKVILCLAGGFPAGCGDAYSYMIDRITRSPRPLPPFGFCALSDGSEYTAHDVQYRYLHRGPEAYDCPEGKTLFYRREEEDRGFGQEITFCYTHTSGGGIRTNRDGDEIDRTIYHERSPATRVNFELNITIEPGTAHEFRSPLFRINYGTGYVSQRTF